MHFSYYWLIYISLWSYAFYDSSGIFLTENHSPDTFMNYTRFIFIFQEKLLYFHENTFKM